MKYLGKDPIVSGATRAFEAGWPECSPTCTKLSGHSGECDVVTVAGIPLVVSAVVPPNEIQLRSAGQIARITEIGQ